MNGTSDRGLGLPRLTSLRWYAALFVFLYHSSTFLPIRLLKPFNFGTVGVTFFFVLSGFVLAWSTRPDLPAKTFYRRRVARIYPSYIVVFGLAVLMIAIAPDIGLSRGWLGIVTTVFMVQAWIPSSNYPVFSYNAPEWSLSCEAFFYALFPFVHRGLRSLSARLRAAVVLASLVLAVTASGLFTHTHYSAVYSSPLIRLPEFMFGMWLAIVVESGWRTRIPVWAAVIIAGVAYELARRVGVEALSGHGDYVVLLPIGLLLAAAATTDLAGRSGFLATPVSVYLGEVSFAFYLVQLPVLVLLDRTEPWRRSWTEVRSVELLAVSFLCTLAAAALLHHVVEIPLQRRLRGPGAASIATEDPEQLAGETASRGRGIGRRTAATESGDELGAAPDRPVTGAGPGAG